MAQCRLPAPENEREAASATRGRVRCPSNHARWGRLYTAACATVACGWRIHCLVERPGSMRILDLARRPPRWLRVALAGLMLGFALNSIAHVSHQHDIGAKSAIHSVVCAHCASFGSLVDAPRHSPLPLFLAAPAAFVTTPVITLPWQRLRTSIQPRAPPRP